MTRQLHRAIDRKTSLLQSLIAPGLWLVLILTPAAQAQPAAPVPKAAAPADQRRDRPLPEGMPANAGTLRHGITEATPKAAGAIRIATYNLENFFDAPGGSPDDAAKPSPSLDEGPPPEPKPESSRQAIADALHKINADILAFQEVESKDVITRFRDKYLKDMGYEYVASIASGDPRHIEQSVLSRFPLSDERVWPFRDLSAVHPAKLGKKDNPEAGKPLFIKRSPLRVTVTAPAAPESGRPNPIALTLFVVHHKSGVYYGYQREAETGGVLSLVSEWRTEHPEANVVVLGDFNARPFEKSFTMYTDAGFADAFGDVVLAPAGKDTTDKKDKKEKEDPRYVTHASGRAIDHILLGPELAKALEVKARFVYATPQRPEHADWRTTLPPSGYASDHYPVVIDLVPRAAAAPPGNMPR